MKGLMNLFAALISLSKKQKRTDRKIYNGQDVIWSLSSMNHVWDYEYEIQMTNEFEKALKNNSNLFKKAIKFIENIIEKAPENYAGLSCFSSPEHYVGGQFNYNFRLHNTVLKFIEILSEGLLVAAPLLKGSNTEKIFDEKLLREIKELCMEIHVNEISHLADFLDINDEVFRSNVFLFVDQIFKGLVPENEKLVNRIFYVEEKRDYRVSPRSIYLKKSQSGPRRG